MNISPSPDSFRRTLSNPPVRTLRWLRLLAPIPVFVPTTRSEFTNGQDASQVLGQIDFSSDEVGTSRSRFSTALPIDVQGGKLALSDYVQRRALVFYNPSRLPDGGPADKVLGKPSFTETSTVPPSPRVIGETSSLAFDAAGRLFILDLTHHRILRFDPPDLEGKCFRPSVSGSTRKGSATYKIANAGASPIPGNGTPKAWRSSCSGASRTQRPVRIMPEEPLSAPSDRYCRPPG